MSNQDDPFFEPYDRESIAYGIVPSAPLAAYLSQIECEGKAIDLGAGAGRDTLALANAGFEVTALDLSMRGLQRIEQRASNLDLQNRIRFQQGDVREVDLASNAYAAIVATTVLDHIPADDARKVWERMTAGLGPNGLLYVETHTTEDPGSDQGPGLKSDAPVSETASAVVNYFAPNQLVSWALEPQSRLRVLRYEERLEWDYTHGAEHLHGKAVLLAVRTGFHPNWFGQPPAFPKREPQ